MTRTRTQFVLSVVERTVIDKCLHVIAEGGRPTVALVIGGPDEQEAMGFVQILDLRDRFRILEDAVAQRQADLCVLAYDGWVEDPLARAEVSRRDALLVVALSRWRADCRAAAVPYEFHEGSGARRFPTIPCPEKVEEYTQVFGPRLIREDEARTDGR